MFYQGKTAYELFIKQRKQAFKVIYLSMSFNNKYGDDDDDDDVFASTGK